MQIATDGGVSSGDRNDGHYLIVSDLVSLIAHVQGRMKLLEAAIAREAAPGNPDAASNIFVLDDVTPRYVKAKSALGACNTSLGVALRYLQDTGPISRPSITGRVA
ncbi:MAG: hypothetical protein Q7J60_18905 [Bradyrhizobium sp.]|nr:hypothetical protein [Bradyrhizobium sp.]